MSLPSTSPKVFQTYKGQLPIELELINCINDCRKTAIDGARTNNYFAYFESVNMFYSTIPPEIQEELIESQEYQQLLHVLPIEISSQLRKLRPLERANATRNLMPRYQKMATDRFYRLIVRSLYHHDLLMKGRSSVEGIIDLE